MCLDFVHTMLGLPAHYRTALLAFEGAKVRHDKYHRSPPAGVPIFFRHADHRANDFGHVALSEGHGKCYTNDIDGPGVISHSTIREIELRWGMEYLGWTEDLNGFEVYRRPHPTVPLPRVIRR